MIEFPSFPWELVLCKNANNLILDLNSGHRVRSERGGACGVKIWIENEFHFEKVFDSSLQSFLVNDCVRLWSQRWLSHTWKDGALGTKKETPQISIDNLTKRTAILLVREKHSFLRDSRKPGNKSWVWKYPCFFSLIHSFFSQNNNNKKKKKRKKKRKKKEKENNKWMKRKIKAKWPFPTT